MDYFYLWNHSCSYKYYLQRILFQEGKSEISYYNWEENVGLQSDNDSISISILFNSFRLVELVQKSGENSIYLITLTLRAFGRTSRYALEEYVSEPPPHMQTMLRMVGFGDNVGSGFPTILATWKTEGWIELELVENTVLNQRTLVLQMEKETVTPEKINFAQKNERSFDKKDFDKVLPIIKVLPRKRIYYTKRSGEYM